MLLFLAIFGLSKSEIFVRSRPPPHRTPCRRLGLPTTPWRIVWFAPRRPWRRTTADADTTSIAVDIVMRFLLFQAIIEGLGPVMNDLFLLMGHYGAEEIVFNATHQLSRA